MRRAAPAVGAVAVLGAAIALVGTGGAGKRGPAVQPGRTLPRAVVASGWRWPRPTAGAALADQAVPSRTPAPRTQPRTTSASSGGALAAWAAQAVTPGEMAAWSKVAVCESQGDWSVQGATHSGGLGFSNSTWATPRYDGTQFAPNAGLATPAEQVVVAMRIQGSVPDQQRCGTGW